MSARMMRWFGGAALAVAMTAAGPAQASTLVVTGWSQPSGHHNVTIGGLGAPADGTVRAGRFALATTTQGTIHTWCVDVFRTLAANQTYQVQPFVNPTVTNGNPSSPVTLSVDQVNAVKGLAAAGNAALDAPGVETTGIFAGYADNIVSAAVQAAIWEVINPVGTFVAAGGSAASRSQVNALFATLTSAANLAQFRLEGASLTAAWLTPVNPRTGQGQGQIWIVPGGGGFEVPVPTPAALLVFAVGLVGLAAARRAA